MACTLAAVAACLAVAIPAAAQVPRASDDSGTSRWSLGAWGGLARNSPGTIWGSTAGRDVRVAAVRGTWPLLRGRLVSWDYVADGLTAVWVSRPPVLSEQTRACLRERPQFWLCETSYVEHGSDLGLGLAPVGLQARFRPRGSIRPYLGVNAGAVRFRRPIPADSAGRLNFTFESGAGVLIGRPGRLGAMAGYKFHHISNGGTAPFNPGIDSHMIYIGLLRLP